MQTANRNTVRNTVRTTVRNPVRTTVRHTVRNAHGTLLNNGSRTFIRVASRDPLYMRSDESLAIAMRSGMLFVDENLLTMAGDPSVM